MATDPTYPTLADVDSALVELIGAADHRPQGMPPGPMDCARWLRTAVLEPPQREEAPRRSSRKGDVWHWPYLDRCLVHARAFLALAPDHQRYVIAARQDGVPWRGDDIDFFRRVYDEHQRMLAMGADAYRTQALQQLRGLRARQGAVGTGTAQEAA